MQPLVLLRAAARTGSSSMLRATAARPAPLMARSAVMNFSTTVPRRSGGEHAEETFEEFTAR
jgi:hypothetical protein